MMSTCECINGRQRAAAIGVLAAVAMLATLSTAFGQADLPRGGGCAPDCSPPKQNIECLNPSPQYDNRTFVGQLLLNGSPWCTAWIVASDGTESVVMTNQHCTAGQNVANMDVKFNYQCDACTNGAPEATQIFPVTSLITQNAGLDYALLRVGGDPAATYGIAQVDSSTATVGMGIYEIHHAGGLVKGYDQGTVLNLNVNACVSNEISVSSLVASGGASGSPIFRLDNHCVTAICNCGPPCQDGFGVPMSNIIPNAQPILQGAGFDFTMCGQGPACPGTGDCCIANGTPGCNDATCCNAICAIDPFCCDTQWDQICADEAAADGVNCPQCQACGTAGAGDCCSANGTPFCDDATCCNAICALDPFCCDTQWDQICANEAAADGVNCPQCGGPPTGACCFKDGTCQDVPGADCAALGGTYQGDGTDCATTTCPPANDNCANAVPIAPNSVTSGTTTAATFDSAGFCGTSNTAPGVWYSVVGTGTDITATSCELNCSGAGGANYDTKISVYQDGCGVLTCVTGNDDNCPGGSSGLLSTVTWCAEVGVEYLVLVHGFSSQSGDFVLELCKGVPCQGGACCLGDASCVDVASQADCVALGGTYQGDGTDCATTNCPHASCGDPAAGNCFDPAGNGTPGCNNAACCEAVCAVDPFCCDIQWDSICAGEAQDLCGNAACGPGAGSCFTPGGNGTPGCDDPACCKKICLIDPFCCSVFWDGFCADEADQFCTSCLEDLNGDGVVGFEDLALLLTSWVAGTTQGDIGGPGGCGVTDGVTDFFDLSCLLSAWAAGACN